MSCLSRFLHLKRQGTHTRLQSSIGVSIICKNDVVSSTSSNIGGDAGGVWTGRKSEIRKKEREGGGIEWKRDRGNGRGKGKRDRRETSFWAVRLLCFFEQPLRCPLHVPAGAGDLLEVSAARLRCGECVDSTCECVGAGDWRAYVVMRKEYLHRIVS